VVILNITTISGMQLFSLNLFPEVIYSFYKIFPGTPKKKISLEKISAGF